MNYKTPGVYVEELAKFPPSVAQVETAIPAFIGYTADGPKNKPTRISSMLEYEALFGKANPEDFAVTFKDGVATATQTKVSDFKMYYAMQMYFANGGGACYIVSVGAENIYYSAVSLAELQAGLDLLKKEDEPTLIVFPDLQGLVASSADVVAAQKAKDLAQYAKDLANTVVDNAEEAVEEATTPEELAQANQELADAESDATIADSILNVAINNLTKITAANTDGAITNAYQLYNKALDQAELLKDRFVIMDVLGEVSAFKGDSGPSSGPSGERLKYGAAYHPKLKTVLSYDFNEADVYVMGVSGVTNLAELKNSNSDFYNQAKKSIESKRVVLTPSSAMAGVYAKVDSTSGVWKSPANLGLNFVEAPTIKISDREQDALNVDPTSGKSINAIRTFTGKGTLVWGARTLDGNSNEWRYISVRRFFNMVEESVKKATERFVFEPNTANTWIRVQTMIENFLNQQWQDGALAGSKPEDAYYVSVGLNKTMSAQDILEGRMVVEIGMAAVRPAEFIVLRFSHKLQES
ncbi:phage tail sheath C-terminal domain-containing protein [Chryseobacterium sp. CFBP8996]|uniref:phage tail sheath C-terminal domain-containing protein n=1 Tax=Chryseobacterium sp. CFBP8996 TaxID=3096529 RepID=UPI002A69D977|nr:phage tail sheath C-terminal domain-containing protein [Chryseobacterium sp. CFBP8996]MDY0933102.1 phage tail sheath C-terminal domain-containing protein [Chryseobacterium sp. CFBP8996]